MRTEVPVLTRCCFCMPLRYGLITWAYLKLFSTCAGLSTVLYALYDTVERFLSASVSDQYNVEDITILSTITVIFTVDAILTTVFIIGGHQKNVKLMRVYYIYGIVVCVCLLLIVLSALIIPTFFYHQYSLGRIRMHLIDAASTIVQLSIHTYFLLLLRSEILKLNSNCEFRFVNNAAQGECVMKYIENVC